MDDITCEELKERMDKGEKIILIDVREEFEHEQFNIGGELISLGSLPSSIHAIENLMEEEIVVYCRSGARSANAKMFLMNNGFKNVRNLTGGMVQWKSKFE